MLLPADAGPLLLTTNGDRYGMWPVHLTAPGVRGLKGGLSHSPAKRRDVLLAEVCLDGLERTAFGFKMEPG